MLLSQLFTPKKIIAEGGNLSSNSPGWQGMPGDHEAEEIDLKIHNRDFMVEKIRELLKAQNESFATAYGQPIWDPKLLDSNQMFSGSSLQFFDVKGVSTQDFMNKLKKTKVGDIDTQVDQAIGDNITAWLKSVIGKPIGNGTFVGFNSSLSALWLLQDPPVKIQVDYELGPYEPAQGKEPARPTEWFAYSHSSDLDDMEQGIKGVFHKWINRSVTHAQGSTKYVARVLKKSVKISPEPVTDADYSFAVTGGQGGGLSAKYKPYIDPQTGEPMEIDGIPVMQLLEPSQRDYIQNLDLQFQTMYGAKRTAADKKLQNSFVGTMELMNNNFDVNQNQAVAEAFLNICFGPGAQMITAGDPIRDRDTKLAAIDYMVENLKLPNAQALRQQAVQMAVDYEAKFNAKRQPTTESRINEAGEVKAQLRKGMPHLRDLKPADFLDLLDEIHDGNGNFKLQNIPLNVKIDGFGGRFGKNAEGKPFMGTSRTEPRYEASFVKYHQQKGTTDPEILGRAQLFDQLFNDTMSAIEMIDSQLGPDFLVNKQVTCEVLFAPFAAETPEGKLKFVGIEYDKLPQGVELVLVPYRIVDAGTGEDIPDSDAAIKAMTDLGSQGSVMLMSNRLVQKDGLDVTAILPPLENIEELKQIIGDTQGKRDRASLTLRNQVVDQLKPIQIALEKAIDEDPNIVGKDMLGQDYEGIVINSRLGPIKVTSQRQKDIIAQKNAARSAARTEQPREGNAKTAVVAIGSFAGHIGHQELFKFTIDEAAASDGDPYLFIGNAEGKDDPIPVPDKVKTWHMLYPEYAKNISAVTQAGGSMIQKIKHELINPLPGKPPRYDNIIIMVGEDRKDLPMPQALMKAVNKFEGYEHVKVSLEVTPRGTGVSFTFLRNTLKTKSPEEALAAWTNAFNGGKSGAAPLPQEWIEHLMDVSRQGMGIQMPQQPQQVQQPVPERLFNALVMPHLTEGDWGKAIGATAGSVAGGVAGALVPVPGAAFAGRAAGSYVGAKIGDKVGDMISPSKDKTEESGDTGNNCPLATQNIKLNLNNRQKAIDEYGYGPLNPDMPNTKFWMKKVDEWNLDSADEAKQSLCGNCAAFDIRQETLDCIAQGIDSGSPEDAEGVIDAGDLGYCKFLKFKCASRRTCDAWVAGGPLVDESIAEARQSAAVKLQKAFQREQDKTAAERKRGEEVMAKAKQDEKKTEAILPTSAFAGSKKNKLGTAGQWNQSKKRPARAGDLVGGDASESMHSPAQQAAIAIAKREKKVDEKIKGADGKACWKGYRYNGTANGSDKCVKVREDVENIISSLVEQLSRK